MAKIKTGKMLDHSQGLHGIFPSEGRSHVKECQNGSAIPSGKGKGVEILLGRTVERRLWDRVRPQEKSMRVFGQGRKVGCEVQTKGTLQNPLFQHSHTAVTESSEVLLYRATALTAMSFAIEAIYS